MERVEKNKENLMKCICMKKCPSYTFACKVKSMPSNTAELLKGAVKGDLSKTDHIEGVFCAFGKSNCITDEKGCACPECAVYKENKLTKVYYCLVEGGR